MPQSVLCRITQQKFVVSDREIDFCKRLNVPLPTICPEERMRCMMAFRNEWKLYPRKCDATGEEILSAYKPGAPFPVYKNEVWWGDSWDGLQYGRDFDFTRSFFDQFQELLMVVPREGTSVFNSENCTYNSHIRQSKNCYLNALVATCEDIYYSYWMVRSKDCFDSIYTNDSTLCYQCSDVTNCYNCIALNESNNCRDSFFGYELRGCSNCIFCSNLNNKSYHIFNKPCAKEEFESLRHKLLNGSWQDWKQVCQQFMDLRAKAIHRNAHMLNCENVTGDHLYNCKNCVETYDAFGGEDCYHSVSIGDSKDVHSSYSVGWPSAEVTYYVSVVRGCQDVAYCTYCWFSNNLRYCDSCVSCTDCFGCVGLRHKQYCILNKQYTKEEYEALVPKIIKHMQTTPYTPFDKGDNTSSLSKRPVPSGLRPRGGLEGSCEWGEFFPGSLCTFGYNETCAQDYMPLSKEEALQRGYNWSDYELPKPDVTKTIPATKLPDNIRDIPDDILNWAIECEVSGKPFRIVRQELKFYRENNLPIPHRHPYQRHLDRMALRNPRQLWTGNCDYCRKEMQSSYSPERSEKVYCEECYLKEVY